MELESGIGLVAQWIGDAHADRVDVAAAALDVVAVEDDHIAAVAAAPFEIAAGARAAPGRRGHFEKARADWQQRPAPPVFADIAVAVAAREAEDFGEIGDGGLER